ncbi:hypothetical protein K504DRAFT_503324 [Pleomassaria siparia CBS 279.74]|uniref:Uncharacterized protein n=1 Tax=Pleomassaria siparia CBS 279.74 TaxID=1314801 RepID=A0A6G1K6X9_9PLEO|nr:hypothetical protein K504DRAFT_503324 [Pleomassaria siparia CBS 279.74]
MTAQYPWVQNSTSIQLSSKSTVPGQDTAHRDHWSQSTDMTDAADSSKEFALTLENPALKTPNDLFEDHESLHGLSWFIQAKSTPSRITEFGFGVRDFDSFVAQSSCPIVPISHDYGQLKFIQRTILPPHHISTRISSPPYSALSSTQKIVLQRTCRCPHPVYQNKSLIPFASLHTGKNNSMNRNYLMKDSMRSGAASISGIP